MYKTQSYVSNADRRASSDAYWKWRNEQNYLRKCDRCHRSNLNLTQMTLTDLDIYDQTRLCIICQHLPSNPEAIPQWARYVSRLPWGRANAHRPHRVTWENTASTQKTKSLKQGKSKLSSIVNSGNSDDETPDDDDSDCDIDLGDERERGEDEKEVNDADDLLEVEEDVIDG